MSESVELGYLISNSEYKSFDEIITVLTNKGKRVAMIAMGVKKITSKNGRNLRFGSLTEFTYFQSRSEDKVSKLKSAHLVEEND
jgi:DNA repair protein RecO (recombination protein O)